MDSQLKRGILNICILQLANGVNHFIETLQNLMVKIQSVSKDMKESSYLVQNEAES